MFWSCNGGGAAACCGAVCGLGTGAFSVWLRVQVRCLVVLSALAFDDLTSWLRCW